MFYEAQVHRDNCFVTLTYAEESLPAGGTLVPADLTNFIKRLRKRVEPLRFRYFAVGEYGDNSGRPHYHGCFFGLGPHLSADIDACWGRGFVSVAEFNEFTAQYTAGYVVKKMTSKNDERLNGRHPEFARMSNRPGLGAGAMAMLADPLFSGPGAASLADGGDVPTHLMMGKKKIPLGRYLRQRLRDEVGMSKSAEALAKQIAYTESEVQVRELFLRARASSPDAPVTHKTALLEHTQGKIWSIESRDKLNSQKGRKKL